MHHVLRVDLFDVPQVQSVVGAEELVGGALTPTIEGDLEAAHEVLAGQDGVLLVPDDTLREVQATRLQHGRVVAQVSVPTPDIEGPAGLQDTREVAKPRMEQAVELLVTDEIIGQGAVLGPQLPGGRLGLLRVTGY